MEKKRSPCKFHAMGTCKKGDACLFSHDSDSTPPQYSQHQNYHPKSGAPHRPYNNYSGQSYQRNYQDQPYQRNYQEQPYQHNSPDPRNMEQPQNRKPPLCNKYCTELYCTTPNCQYTHQFSTNNTINRSKFLLVPCTSMSGLCIYNQSKLIISSAQSNGCLFQYLLDMNPNGMQKLDMKSRISAILAFKEYLICGIATDTPKEYGLIIFNEKGETQPIKCHENEITDMQIFSEEKNIFIATSCDFCFSVWMLVSNCWKAVQVIKTDAELESICCLENSIAIGNSAGKILIYGFDESRGFEIKKIISLCAQKTVVHVFGIVYDKANGIMACIAGNGLFLINIKQQIFPIFDIISKYFDKIELLSLAFTAIKIGEINERVLIIGDQRGRVKIREFKFGLKELDSIIAHKSAVRKIMAVHSQTSNCFYTLGLQDTLSLWEFNSNFGTLTDIQKQQMGEGINDSEMASSE